MRIRNTSPISLMQFGVLAGLFFASPLFADDWPQWRGANRDGVVRDIRLPENLPAGEIPETWSAPVGPGYSGPTVADGRVYLTDRGGADDPQGIERILCFDAETGAVIWKHVYESVYTSIGYRAGPRAAVTVHGDVAIAVGAMGKMHCLDSETGEVRWAHDLAAELDVRMPKWGIAASPLVYQDLVIQISGGGEGACVVAFDLDTGAERWRSLDERAGYSSPIIVRQGEQDVVVCWTGESVSGLDPLTGKPFWAIPMLPRNMPIGVPTPVVQDNHLFVSSFYDGSLMIQLDPDRPAAEQLWYRVGRDENNTDALHCMIGTPIIKGDYIYGVDSYGQLRCLEVGSGDRVWEDTTAVPGARWATIHIMRFDDGELMLNDRGELIVAELTPEGFNEIDRAPLIEPTRQQLGRRDGVVWSHPAIADNAIFARNDQRLIRAPLNSAESE